MDIIEMHSFTLEIGKCFHNICKELNIPYYMLGGTMLGAVRHKGFIPWDDDMDFGIPRRYFEEFEIKCKSLLPDYYKLVCSKEYEFQINYDTIKIVDTRFSIAEVGKEASNVNMGLFIDIFPLDESNGSWSVLSRNKLVESLLRWNSYKYIPLPDGSSKKIKTIAAFVNLLPHDYLKRLAHSLFINEGTHYSNYGGYWGMKETISKDVFGTPRLYEFEGAQLFGVEDSNSYLQSLYGDYMQLPPEDKRHSHIIHCRKIN